MRKLKRWTVVFFAVSLLLKSSFVYAQDIQDTASVQTGNSAQSEASVQTGYSMQPEASIQAGDGAQSEASVQTRGSTQSEALVQEGNNSRADQTTRLVIDNENLYEGMDKTYSDGYVPLSENGTAHLVMPLVSTKELKGNSLKVSLNLGEPATMPFVSKNYVKTVSLKQVKINDGAEKVECYLVSFDLELKEDRCNGSYPVVLTGKATDADGNAVSQKFTIYVTIADGKTSENNGSGSGGQNGDGSAGTGSGGQNGDGGSGTGSGGQNGDGGSGTDAAGSSGVSGGAASSSGSAEGPSFAPKLVVQMCKYSKETIYSGDEVQMDITLVNTSTSETIRNLTVTIGGQSEYFSLLSQSDTIYVDSVSAGATLVVSYKYKVNAAAPQGQYNLDLAMDYADSEGAAYTGSGKVQISVEQQMKVEFDPLVISSEVQVADVVEAQIQAMNLGRGKVYNVRAVLEADGLVPNGTIFIGDMEAGTTASASTQVSVTSLTEGSSLYGTTEGTVTFYYEDEAGNEYEETAGFTTTITSPFSDTEEEEDETGQWWIIMAVIGVILCAFLVVMAVRVIRRRKQDDMEMVE